MLKLTDLRAANTAACTKASLEGKLDAVDLDQVEIFIAGKPWEDAEMRRRLQPVIKAEIRERLQRIDAHLADLGVHIDC